MSRRTPSAIMVAVGLALLIAAAALTTSACRGVAGTYRSSLEAYKDKNGTSTIDWFLELDDSGRYSMKQVSTSSFDEANDIPPLEMFIEAGTWTLDGDELALKPKNNGEFPAELKSTLGEDPMAVTKGTLRGDTITLGDMKFAKE
jgi:hypothetical protein